MKPYSITRRLITTVLLIELASALCVTAVAYIYERHDHFRSFDILLRGRADSLLGAVQDSEDASNTLILDNSEVEIPEDDIYEVRDDQNRLLGHSAHLPDLAAQFQPEDDKPGKIDSDGDQATFGKMRVGHKAYRIIRMFGVRTIDTANPQGGIRRNITLYYGASDRPVWRAIRKAVTFYALSSLIVLAVTGILMAWLLNRSLASLRELASRASTISVNSWTFDPPEDARRIRELRPLVTALENVLQGLQHSFEQQRRFVGDAAHELKTNVAVVKSSLQLLSMKPRTSAEYQHGVERSLVDLQRMEETVAQMLTLARLEESTSIAASESSTQLFPCLREIGLQLEVMAQASGVPIHFSGDRSLVAAIDPEQFRLLCTNLLMNALQHSDPDAFIHVELERRAAFAEMRIMDEGEGIDLVDLPHIFERFYRSDPSRSRKTGGTGLGLAICKAITDSVQGAIAIDSQPGKGTTVVVRLPLAAPKPQAEG